MLNNSARQSVWFHPAQGDFGLKLERTLDCYRYVDSPPFVKRIAFQSSYEVS
jgi:hypothetical protein